MTALPSAQHPAPNRKRSSGLISFNTGAEVTEPGPRTFIVFGVPRGGTSAVAGALLRLGVDMGPKLPKNHEDPDFVKQDIAHMAAAIERRNQDKTVWGWKYPEAAGYLEDIIGRVRNPHLVLVCRDPAALMQGLSRWGGYQPLDALQHSVEAQMANIDLVRKLELPTAVVSYEKVLVYPRRFVRQLAKFSGMPVPEKDGMREIVSFLEAGSYKSAERT